MTFDSLSTFAQATNLTNPTKQAQKFDMPSQLTIDEMQKFHIDIGTDKYHVESENNKNKPGVFSFYVSTFIEECEDSIGNLYSHRTIYFSDTWQFVRKVQRMISSSLEKIDNIIKLTFVCRQAIKVNRAVYEDFTVDVYQSPYESENIRTFYSRSCQYNKDITDAGRKKLKVLFDPSFHYLYSHCLNDIKRAAKKALLAKRLEETKNLLQAVGALKDAAFRIEKNIAAIQKGDQQKLDFYS